MNFTYKMIEIAKKNAGINSDYGFAKLIMVSPQMLSNWKNEKSEASAEYIIRIMAVGEIKPIDALSIMTERRAKGGEVLNLTTLQCILCKVRSHSRLRIMHQFRLSRN